jgi:phage baseplate assembly protein W
MSSIKDKPNSFEFKSTGINSLEQRISKEKVDSIIINPIGIKTPLRLSENDNDSLFEMHRNIEDVIRDNLRNLLLTNKGERLGRHDFGTSLRSLTFEMINNENFEQIVMNDIQIAVEKYLPYIELDMFSAETIKFENDDIKGISTLLVKVGYNVTNIGIKNKELVLKINIGG